MRNFNILVNEEGPKKMTETNIEDAVEAATPDEMGDGDQPPLTIDQIARMAIDGMPGNIT